MDLQSYLAIQNTTVEVDNWWWIIEANNYRGDKRNVINEKMYNYAPIYLANIRPNCIVDGLGSMIHDILELDRVMKVHW